MWLQLFLSVNNVGTEVELALRFTLVHAWIALCSVKVILLRLMAEQVLDGVIGKEL